MSSKNDVSEKPQMTFQKTLSAPEARTFAISK